MNIKLTVLRIGSGLFGLIALITGAKMIYQGASGKLGEAAVAVANAGVLPAFDNDFRFLAAIWLIVGLGLLVGTIFIHTKLDLVQLGLEAIFLGGIVRLLAFAEFGPLPQFYVPIAVELVFPIILLVILILHKKSLKAASR